MAVKQVLIISFWNPTEENPQQGLFIQDQAAAICDLRDNVVFLQVNVLSSKNIILKKEIEEVTWHNNSRIILNLYSRLWKFWYINPWLLTKVIYRIIRKSRVEVKPEIIHSNVIFPCGVVGYLLAKKMGAKTMISEHWSKVDKLLRNHLYKNVALKAYHECFAIICVSEYLSDKIAGVTNHPNVAVIPNIINTQLFTYLPKVLPDYSILTFMCVASWRKPKRLDLIVDALCEYAHETHRQLELKIVGKGPQTEIVKNKEIPNNLHIELMGYLDKKSIAVLLQSTMVFLHASETETFSIVTAEALSTGTPVIASKVGALPELINVQNGILAENSRESWLQAIREIASKKFDYEAIARQNQTKFSPITVGRSIISIYDKTY
jgi:L-malate glycosyltransferase